VTLSMDAVDFSASGNTNPSLAAAQNILDKPESRDYNVVVWCRAISSAAS
jgi:hypothetical protein